MSTHADDDAVVAQIAAEIYHYLLANPRSSDTVEGIEKWWLPDRSYARAKIKLALALLVAQRKITVRTQSNGDEYFTLIQ